MRILHLLSQTELTGAEVYAQNLVAAQAATGHDVFVISDKIHVTMPISFVPMKISTKSFFVRMRNIFKIRQFLKEKNAMQRIWKQREKQIEKVVNNTINMYASIKGIAGNAIQPVKALELDHENLIELE